MRYGGADRADARAPLPPGGLTFGQQLGELCRSLSGTGNRFAGISWASSRPEPILHDPDGNLIDQANDPDKQPDEDDDEPSFF